MASQEKEKSNQTGKLHYVYILYCADGSLYTGYTTDLKKRVRAHNGEIKGGAAYTRARRPVRLIWHRSFPSKAEAMREEYRIKQMTHEEKEAMVRQYATSDL